MRFVIKPYPFRGFFIVTAISLMIYLTPHAPSVILKAPQEAVISKSVCDEVLKQKASPPPVTKFKNKPATVTFTNYPEAKDHYIGITKQAAEGPNFAGHFTYVEWGCGINCLGYAVVDSITGNIVSYQGGEIPLVDRPSYDINSRLLVFNPKQEFDRYYGGGTLENIIKEGENYPIASRDYFELIEEASGSARLDLFCTENVLDGIYSTESGPANAL